MLLLSATITAEPVKKQGVLGGAKKKATDSSGVEEVEEVVETTETTAETKEEAPKKTRKKKTTEE